MIHNVLRREQDLGRKIKVAIVGTTAPTTMHIFETDTVDPLTKMQSVVIFHSIAEIRQ